MTCLVMTGSRADLPELGDPTQQEITPYQEHLMGKNFYKTLRSNIPFVEDLIVNDYLNTLAQRLVSQSDQPENHFKFFILKVPSINAFAGPDGYIGIHSGLYLSAVNESELAGVLAHEISHVTQRHLARAMTESQTSPATMFAAILAGILVGAQDPTAGAAIIYGSTAAVLQSQINFTRQNEYEADRVAIKVLRDAGINPQGMAQFFETLLSRAESDNLLAQMEYLRTHPLNTTRIAEAKHRILESDKKLPSDSLNFHLSQARVSVDTAQSLLDFIHRVQTLQKNTPNLVNTYTLAIAYTAFDQPKPAIRILNGIIAQRDHPWFRLALARAYEKDNQQKVALKVLKELDQLYPNYMPVSIEYARTLINMNMQEDAILLLKRLLQHQRQPIIYLTLAQAYYSNGQITAALEATSYQYELEGYLNLAAQQVENALKQPGLNINTRERLKSRREELGYELKREQASKY
jgi:predicted Zn-dependent protease